VWLGEMWDCVYPTCRDPSCCLLYECTRSGYEHTGICRHWEYLSSRCVHLDRFRHTHDCLLAMTLSVHRDALGETQGEYEEPAGGWRYVNLKVTGFGMASELTKNWSGSVSEESVKQAAPVFGVLSAVLVDLEYKEVQRATRHIARGVMGSYMSDGLIKMGSHHTNDWDGDLPSKYSEPG
jgi:hypothetical protein